MRNLETRVPPPVLALLLAGVMWGLDWAGGAEAGQAGRRLAGLAFLAAGIMGFPALGAFRARGTTIDPVHVARAQHLVTGGVYRVSRNPMYVALTLLLIAWALWLGGAAVWAGPVVFVLWIDLLQIRPEERALTERFGAEYEAYRRTVRRWL